MDSKKANSAIKCTVSDCTYNNYEKAACSLNAISVGCCGPATTDCACTECASYKKSK